VSRTEVRNTHPANKTTLKLYYSHVHKRLIFGYVRTLSVVRLRTVEGWDN